MFPIRKQNRIGSRRPHSHTATTTHEDFLKSIKKMLPALSNTTNTTRHLHLENNNAQHSPSGSSTPKRSPSMIFRIEHLLPTSTDSAISSVSTPSAIVQLQAATGVVMPTTVTSPGNITRRTKSNRSPGVYLKHFTPRDTVSDTISTMALMSAPSGVEHSDPSDSPRNLQSTRTYCSITQGLLRLSPTAMRRVKLSEDIHSYNALFELYNGDVRLRTVRDIARDEELIAWFDDEVTLLMSIPFLSPINIQGNNRYTCHLCHLTFETPNPLKIHLALACGRHTLDILWIRLHYTLKSTVLSQHGLQIPFVHNFPTMFPAHRPTVQINSSSTIMSPSSPATSTQSHRLSAFKPISTSNSQTTSSMSSSSSNMLPVTTSSPSLPLTSHSTTSISFLPSIATAATLSPMNHLLQPSTASPLNAAAQIEAIVSNMGASKQGHLCIYCGKVYSRKYGLKIHIRTHTGFKPLKCKFCLRPFGDPSNLNKHVRLHLQSSASSSSGEAVDGYKCHMCHKTLARRRDLQRHIESRHNVAS